MNFNIESHLLLVLNYVLTHERQHFFETFEVTSQSDLDALMTNPAVQHIWKSARIVTLNMTGETR